MALCPSAVRKQPGANVRLMSLVLLMSILVWPATAAWLDFVPITLRQPDGSYLYCYASGDEYHNWLHDQEGYTIIQHPRSGWYVYAVPSGDELAASEMIAGRTRPAGIEPWLTFAPALVSEIRAKRAELNAPESVTGPPTGNISNIVVFIRFADDPEFTEAPSTYTSMFNATTAGTSSLYNYFKEASYNQVVITSYFYPTPGTTVLSYQDSHARAYFKPYDSTNNPTGYKSSERTSREHTLLHAALQHIKPQVSGSLNLDTNNDGRVDNVCFIIKGSNTGWSELLWPHMWSLSSYSDSLNGKRVTTYNFQIQSMMGTSVLCHEMGHSLGAPDLYRYNNKKITPVGTWDLMSNNSTPPQQMGVHMKVRWMKWLPALPVISTPGRYVVNRLTVPTQNGYRIPSPYSKTQYFVVEYRSRKNTIFEQSNEGLLVYRVDSLRSGNANGPPDEIYIYRPGGDTGKTGDLSKAAFSKEAGRTAINDWTDPWPLLSNQKPGGLNISDVSARGDTMAFTLNPPLPARVDSLAAFGMGDSVVVVWRTAAEYRCKRFDVQRSVADSTTYQTIVNGFAAGGGTTTTTRWYRFADRFNTGQKFYRLALLDSGNATVYTWFVRMKGLTGIADEPLAAGYSLEQNFPNPFNPATVIRGQWSVTSDVNLVVYDVLGREVARLANGRYPAGSHAFTFDAAGLASGVYIYRLTAGDFVATKRMVLIR